MEKIREIKVTLKKLLASNLEAVIDELLNKLNPESKLFDEVIIQQSRFIQVKNDFNLNVLSKENRDLVLDKIRSSLLSCINNIERSDFTNKSLTNQFMESKSLIIIRKEELRIQMEEILSDIGFDFKSLIQKRNINIREEIIIEISSLLKKMEKTEYDNGNIDNGNWHLTMGEAFLTKRNWDKSAYHLEKASEFFPDNWELHFSKSMVYANSRKGKLTDIKALKSYSETIVYLPTSIDLNLKGRILIYKGAMFKRLNRLDEAEADLFLAKKIINGEYEKQDLFYNLA